ncbi:MAG: ribosome maturation factor RimM [Candidatus Neomarinimicrobiota bacterium]|nr:ribosome maturation factor RimM [Candidatus Neomarinimicrobiota bacterium]
MKTKLFAIAKITRATGLKGDVGVRPLIRQFDEYVDRDLFIGFDENFAKDVKLTNVSGTEKKPRFHFEGLDSRDDAESMIGQLLFASINEKDPINLISPDLIGASVVTVSGEPIGKLVDMMSLPAHDAYVISNNSKEVLIPVVPEFIYSVDVMEGLVTISPVEGLLD